MKSSNHMELGGGVQTHMNGCFEWEMTKAEEKKKLVNHLSLSNPTYPSHSTIISLIVFVLLSDSHDCDRKYLFLDYDWMITNNPLQRI